MKSFAVLLLTVVYLRFSINARDVYPSRKRNKTQDAYDSTSISFEGESCVEAKPSADQSLTKAICHPYRPIARRADKNVKRTEVCKSTVGDDLLFATPAEQEWRENLFVTYTIRSRVGKVQRMPKSPSRLLTKFCWQLIVHMYCRFFLPKCDMTSSRPRAQPICREACREFKSQCQKEWTQAQRKFKSVSWAVQKLASGLERSSSLMWCKDLPRQRGPDIPECYYPKMLQEKKEKPRPFTDTCFHDDGRTYRGNVSVTRSGYKCQSWTSQCPHRHHRTPENFPELNGAGNACRNPGGQAPNGPWCYTTTVNQRWEYCNVINCETLKKSKG